MTLFPVDGRTAVKTLPTITLCIVQKGLDVAKLDRQPACLTRTKATNH